MIFSIVLSVAGFLLMLVALLYDPEEGRLRYPLWDDELGRPYNPGKFVLIIAGIGFAIFLASLLKVIVDGVRLERAETTAAREQARVLTQISRPEFIITAEFPEDDLLRRAAASADAGARLEQLRELVRLTPIPPDPCNGIELRRGAGAVPLIGDMLTADGGLTFVDFAMTLGFYRTDKDISGFAKDGFELFDMTLGVNGDQPEARLSYLPEAHAFRLVMIDEADGLDTDPTSITAVSDLPGATVVLEPATPTNAFERGFVKSLFIRDKLNGAMYGIDLATLQPATADSGWPPHTMLAELGPTFTSCVTESPPGPASESGPPIPENTPPPKVDESAQ